MTNPEIYVIVRLETKNNYFTERTPYHEEHFFRYLLYERMAGYSQIKWAVINKPDVRDAYVLNKVNQELWEGIDRTNRLFEEFDKEYIVVFE